MRNVELKAIDRDPGRSLSVCESIGVEAGGVLAQQDTYFHAPEGRLKLREEAGATAHLIAYQRPDRIGQRESRYRIVEVEQGEKLKLALSATLGVRTVVSKQRHLFLWEGVRIHLDRVEGLGSFIEFEAIVTPESDLSRERAQVSTLREAFAIVEADEVGASYCDLVAEGEDR